MTTSKLWEPPKAFDDFVIVKFLGRGAMGEVWLALARDVPLDREVAIKFIAAAVDPTPSRLPFCSRRGRMRARFRRELDTRDYPSR